METFIKKFKKSGTAELLKRIEKLTGIEKQACAEVLAERGQDVSKWVVASAEVKEEVKEIANVTETTPTLFKPYEAEPETELTPAEEKLIKAAEAELDKTIKSSLQDKAIEHLVNFKKGSDGENKINQILRGRKVTKMSDTELKLILAIPVDTKKPADKPKTDKPKDETSTPKEKVETPEGYFNAGEKVILTKSDNTEIEGVVVDLKFNDKKVPFYRVKADGKVICRVPKYVRAFNVAVAEEVVTTEEQKEEAAA